MLGSWKHNCPVIAQIDVHCRFKLEFLRKLGIHAGARGRKRLQGSGSFDGTIDQHPARGIGGLTARLSALNDENGCAAPAQREGEREADDASADNDYIPSFHLGIVKERRPRMC